MRVFREVEPEMQKEVRPVLQQEAMTTKSVTPPPPPTVYVRPRYSPEEYRNLRRTRGRDWRQIYVFAAMVLICMGIVYLAFFSEKPMEVNNSAAESLPSAEVSREESKDDTLGTVLPQTVRVLITNQSDGYLHDTVTISCSEDFWIEAGEDILTMSGSLTLSVASWPYKTDTIRLNSAGTEAKFAIQTLSNVNGDPPAYRGCIEVTRRDGALTIINDVYLEQYLYAVITSEMPESFGLEALKAQAVCARSFAVKQMELGKVAQYGADLDDLVSSQTYNDWPETELAIQAVEETRGQVILENGTVIAANYFSTSCGMTADFADAWPGGMGPACLKSARQYVSPDFGELNNEDNFRQFITTTDLEATEADTGWFRWNVSVPRQTLDDQIRTVLPALPDVMQLENDQFAEYNGTDIGTLKAIYVYERASCGMIKSILLEGSSKTVKVSGEYNIRRLLAPTDSTVNKLDGSTKEGMSALPSAFWCADHAMDENGTLLSVTFYGGGYGHGVGMSQVGAWKMAEAGADYKAILQHYYSGAQVGFLG